MALSVGLSFRSLKILHFQSAGKESRLWLQGEEREGCTDFLPSFLLYGSLSVSLPGRFPSRGREAGTRLWDFLHRDEREDGKARPICFC